MRRRYARVLIAAATLPIVAWATAAAQTPVTIPQIQGATHTSPFNGALVATGGVVTAVDSNGFYLQDPIGDGDDATSDGVFVFTGSSPSVAAGDRIDVTAVVTEFRQNNRPRNLTVTQLSTPTISILSSGNATPAPTLLGPGGRAQPTSVIEDDAFASYDPAVDGIDFYESLEGMLVEIPAASAVDTNTRFDEIWIIPSGLPAATGANSRGGVTIGPGDLNPERIQIQRDGGIQGAALPSVEIGDTLARAVGVVGYSFGDYEVSLTEPLAVTGRGGVRESSALVPTENRLTVASYNVLNLDPFDSAAKFATLGADIAQNLNSPDIVALQEIQDSDGPGGNARLDADATYAALIAAIESAGGPSYEFAEVAPPSGNIDGGQPTGNIRTGYLYNADRVDLIPGSLIRHGDGNPAFNGSRKPLEATFAFNGEAVTLVNNHFRSKGGSTGLFENVQPPVNGGASTREGQAEFVADLVDQILFSDPDANVIVLGDLNEFAFETPLAQLLGGPEPLLNNLEELLDPTDRYTFIFDGNSQSLDHILVTDGLLHDTLFDAVHLNTGLLDAASDHDPLLASFFIPVPEPSAVALALLGFILIRRRPHKKVLARSRPNARGRCEHRP